MPSKAIPRSVFKQSTKFSASKLLNTYSLNINKFKHVDRPLKNPCCSTIIQDITQLNNLSVMIDSNTFGIADNILILLSIFVLRFLPDLRKGMANDAIQ